MKPCESSHQMSAGRWSETVKDIELLSRRFEGIRLILAATGPADVLTDHMADDVSLSELSALSGDDAIRAVYIESDVEAYRHLRRLFEAWFGTGIRFRHIEHPDHLNADEDGYDLVITELSFAGDATAPEEMLRRITHAPQLRDTPVVVITALDDPRLPLRAFQEGVAEFYTKFGLRISLMEHRLRNLVQREIRARALRTNMSDLMQRFEHVEGASRGEIRSLQETIEQMRRDLESEYEEKLRLEKEKNRMQNVFGMYVDPKIVQGIMQDEITLEQKGERQEMTVMFADLRDYTGMTENMEPEKVISFLNEFFTSMTEVIMGYGGMVDKYIGDGIMALFGAPIAEENHRDNAVLTAMEMFSIFELWQTNWEAAYGIRPAMGIGLASGEAVVGNVGSFQKISYTAVGDTVNLAARLEGLARPGQLLLSKDLYDNISEESRSRYQFEQLEPFTIKGKSAAQQVYRLVKEFEADDIIQLM